MSILPLLVLVVIIFAIKKTLSNKELNAGLSYIKKDYLFTQAEKDFYFVLREILKNDYTLFSKVRLLDLFYMPKGITNSSYYGHRNKIQSKHVDFIICDKENIKPLLAIELDDSSHSRADRVSRDILVDRIFKGANLPILHIRTASSYNSEDLLRQIQTSLNIDSQSFTSS